MLCIFCGAEMRLVKVEQDGSMMVTGYEYHTFECSSCQEVERRLTFTHEPTPHPGKPVPVDTAPALSLVTKDQNEASPPMSPASTDQNEAAPSMSRVLPIKTLLRRLQPWRLQVITRLWFQAVGRAPSPSCAEERKETHERLGLSGP